MWMEASSDWSWTSALSPKKALLHLNVSVCNNLQTALYFLSSVFYCYHLFSSALLFSPAEDTSAKPFSWKKMMIHFQFPDECSRLHSQDKKTTWHRPVLNMEELYIVTWRDHQPWNTHWFWSYSASPIIWIWFLHVEEKHAFLCVPVVPLGLRRLWEALGSM